MRIECDGMGYEVVRGGAMVESLLFNYADNLGVEGGNELKLTSRLPRHSMNQ